jgi:hypothetical protein
LLDFYLAFKSKTGISWKNQSFWPKRAIMYGCLAGFARSGFLHSLKPQVDGSQQNSIEVKPIENYT